MSQQRSDTWALWVFIAALVVYSALFLGCAGPAPITGWSACAGPSLLLQVCVTGEHTETAEEAAEDEEPAATATAEPPPAPKPAPRARAPRKTPVRIAPVGERK